jgi:membrane associated rhomboid family serine protease
MALLPLKDDNTITNINFQYVTVSLIITCTAVFLWQLSLGAEQGRYIFGLGTIPSVLFGTRNLSPELILIPETVTMITSLFLHGGWMHLILNMLFLWVFGDNIEDAMGHIRYLLFYLICGVLATLSHAVMEADSIRPLIGASGAISGVLGAYLVLHPKSRVLVLFMNIIPLRLPAILVLGAWIGMQFLSLNSNDGTAWWAHIGGFLAGMILVVPFRLKSVPLFDGFGKFGPDNPNVVDLAERRHARSIFPNTVAASSSTGPWNRPVGKPDNQPFGVADPKDLPRSKKPPDK